MRRLAAVVGAFVGVAVAVTPGSASADVQGGGANNVVNVINTAGSSLRSHVQLAFSGGPNNLSSNVADALSQNCLGCHTRAVAIQEVVVTGDPTYFSPRNAASAINASCTGCDTFSYAYQNVIQTSAGVHLSPAVAAQVSDLTAQIDAAVGDPALSDIPSADGSSPLTSTLDDLAHQLDQVVESGLTANGAAVLGDAAYREAPAAVN